MNTSIDQYNTTTTTTTTENYTHSEFFIVIGYIMISGIVLVVLCYIVHKLFKNVNCNYLNCIKQWLINNHPNFRHLRDRENDSQNIRIEILGKIEIPIEENFNNECTICLEKFSNQELYRLHCDHAFHLKCWNKWVKHSKKRNCPLCRYDGS